MAAEVPAKDVLCEAMEYLSKLGSNLRVRSDNLREKKIRREKLNNVLAVQKAANKVLLICELSKKSLENVETGIRKVLTLIDTSQATLNDGCKKSVNKSKEETSSPQYYYFEYRSRKLRIKKRISLKHYTSVRVMAKSMPKSMMDNYPVHYNCKLFRQRHQEDYIQPKDKLDGKEKDSHVHLTGVQSKEYIETSIQDSETLLVNIPDTQVSKLVSDDESVNAKSVQVLVNSAKSQYVHTEMENKSHSSCDSIDKSQQRSKSRMNEDEPSKERSHSRDSEKSQKTTEEKEENSVKTNSKDSDDTKSSSEANREKNRKSSITSSKSEKNENEKKKFKKLRVIDDSSDDDLNTEAGERIEASSQKYKSDDSSQEPNPKRQKLRQSTDETHSEGDKNRQPIESTTMKNCEINQELNKEPIKPMIKCVSLTKLLKPDVLTKETHLLDASLTSKPKGNLPSLHKTKVQKESKKEKREAEKLLNKESKDEEYWILKRKEVKSFKSKNFSVNLARLPELSIDFLNKQNLRIIIQDGVTICEIPHKNLTPPSLPTKETNGRGIKNKTNLNSDKSKIGLRPVSSNKSDTDNDELIAEANKVKNSLLNESDSDDEMTIVEKATDKDSTKSIKSTLLNDSDSENKNSDDALKPNRKNEKGDDCSVMTEALKAKKSLCNESSSESENNESKEANSEAIKLKNSLLNNSDSDSGNKSSGTAGEKEVNTQTFDVESDKIDSSNSARNTETICNKDSGILKTAPINNVISSPVERKNVGSDSDSNVTGDKNSNKEKGQDGLVGNNEEQLRESKINEKTPEKDTSTPGDSDDKTKTPLSQRLTPQSKKKRIRETAHAKKMLLTYSSSDTEDEELKNALKEIKDALLHGSDDENSNKKQEQKDNSKESSPCSSADDILKKVNKNLTIDSKSSKRRKIKRRKTHRRQESEDSNIVEQSDSSKSSRSKMVRSKSKPGNSSSQNSDAPDSNDKDIDGLTNLETLNKPKTRRRNSSSSEVTEKSSMSNARSRRSRVKPTGLICEEMLKAETSSDAVSVSEDENDEDLPPVTLPTINGGGEHLVKEDLLGESDSSLTNDDEGDKDDSESEEKLKARRRKANAISSDSEVGSSRKKDADVKLSDFEESDDSMAESSKRSKRKKKATDSDASVGSNSSNEAGKKKRRRIKSLKDSDASGSDSENEGKNKHGRKNIRRVMGKNQLEEATKKAAREEKERVARIAERQKMYNNLEFDESGKPDEVVLDKVVLDFDPDTKEPLIEVDRGLVKKLKPHQANGIKFMWNACFESVKRIKKDKGSGCILAHCMGLGKTLQVVSLTHTLLIHGDLTGVNRVLVVCPLSTVLNWVNEFKMWLKYASKEYEVDVYELSRFKQNSERAFQLSQWFRHGGVCVLGYEMFRNLSADNVKKFKKKMLKNFQEALVDPGPDLVVCDEGHLLKNEKTSLSQSMNRVRTLRRIVLTGTPLQNNLKEYYCMVQFVKPNLLGKYNEYLNRFVNPITNGQYTDSTEHDIKIMKRRSHVLHTMLDGAVQRRDYGVLAPFLPPKHEYVLFITLSEVQTKLYQHYLDNFSRRPLPGKSSGFLFPDFQSLQRIWTHPLVLKYNSERYEIMQQKKRDKEEEDSEGSLVDFIDDDSTPNETSTDESSDDSSEMSDDSRKKNKKKKNSKKSKGKDKDKEAKADGGNSKPRRGTRANPIEIDDDEQVDEIIETKYENPTEWWIKLVEESELEDMRNSHKLVLLFDILRQCEAIGDKLLVFSQSLYSLDLIERFLGKVDEATQEGRIDEKLGGHVGSWSPGVDYFRLDGSTSCENRSIWCKNFNREDNPRARLFLISTRAGGLGINLVAANRVVIFDVSWNPSHDVQSIFRVYRFGQKKPCYIYRFLAMGTMEEKIYERQVTKQAISKRVIDEQQIDRHYAENDLAELYKFEPKPPVPRPIPPLPKDRLFAEMLREHEAQIYKYHEHDSLLENKEEETLSEEERKAAWEDFENEKNKPPPAPFPSAWPMHNGMVPSLLAQQQQQLAYAALAAMLRKDMPNLNDNQLRDMLPLIYNANPQMFGGYDYGLMQKMSEIYKYSQPGMMNPGMMNPGVMNAGGGAGGMSGMGGASGLQYEPPWQRQQQTQQQMQLQQLMQQQNQMGAKFYAGGLGSRDPVAMALQQQRAREIMLGNSAAGVGGGGALGRPRGRPPMQPRAPPQADVVDLDSD